MGRIVRKLFKCLQERHCGPELEWGLNLMIMERNLRRNIQETLK